MRSHHSSPPWDPVRHGNMQIYIKGCCFLLAVNTSVKCLLSVTLCASFAC
jgi:hypothetical protein